MKTVLLEVTRERWTMPTDMPQDVAPQPIVLRDPGAHPSPRGIGAPEIPTHALCMDRQILGQHKRCAMRPILEHVPLAVRDLVELGRIVRADPAEHDKPMAARHGIERIELKAAQGPCRREHPFAVGLRPLGREPLSTHRQPSGVVKRKQERLHGAPPDPLSAASIEHAD